MTSIIVENTGVDGLYPDGVPIAEVSCDIDKITRKVARVTSLAAQTDPFFSNHNKIRKELSELHGEGTRIFKDFLEDGADDILPVFQPMQRWMNHFTDSDDNLIVMFEYDTDDNPGKVIYRWQIMDTRSEDYKFNYTSEVSGNIITDLNVVRNVQKYIGDALRDYVYMEFYKTIGYQAKAIEYKRSYYDNRNSVALWAKNDISLTTARTSG